MKKIKLLMPAVLSLSACTPILMLTSCNQDEVMKKLQSMPRVSKVEKLSDNPRYKARYMVYFSHPLDWNDESKGSFTQRVEFDFRGLDKVNQLFTCGYELRQEKESRMNDYEIADHFQGNVIKPEYRFFDQSRPSSLSNESTEGWQYLNNTQAAADFHSMITSFKTILSGKWAFSGSSKGGETTNCFAMLYPDDCNVYVPYVAPAFYARGSHTFQENVYGNIGVDVLGEATAKEWQTELSKFQLYALKNRNTEYDGKKVYLHFWDESTSGLRFNSWATENKEVVYDLCIMECATAFWQYDQDINRIKAFNVLTETDAKLKELVSIAIDLNSPASYCIDSLFFPYYYQAATEMGEYSYDFTEMIAAIVKNTGETEATVDALLKADKDSRSDLLWKMVFNENQRYYWVTANEQDMTLANKLQSWNKTCFSKVFMIYGGADTWSALRLDETEKSDNIKVYFGKDTTTAKGRTHYTRISTLSDEQQKEIWPQIEELLN